MADQFTTHASLLLRLKDGAGTVAWNEFHERYGSLIRGFARRRGLQPADCEDVAQEVMLSLSKAMPNFQYDPGKGKFRAYLKTTVIRAISRKSQGKRGEMALGNIEEMTRCAETDAEIEAIWELEWQRYHLRQAMRILDGEFDETECQAFQQYAIDGRGARETADALGISVKQVYYAKSRILGRLKRVIALQVQEEG